ncbi:Uncharacterised protein [Mycobacteroides abscessus subsp. abscessus]|jgi:hypothetical protein|uniref:hypothetical protein n=1 Tax=Mycobacteroides abscessus TaxID=36809 RepID=UPI00092C5B92|nr:hypothetical protein [Mycobacteroides abscessus]SIH23097.1 Uncharacterised protein [Mycobacteroides abscessus subsp. abscessus]
MGGTVQFRRVGIGISKDGERMYVGSDYSLRGAAGMPCGSRREDLTAHGFGPEIQ